MRTLVLVTSLLLCYVHAATVSKSCPGGQIYNECGLPCTRTCENLQPWCMYEYMDSWDCEEGCECPDEAPFWQDGRCIPYKECPVNFTPYATRMEETTPNWDWEEGQEESSTSWDWWWRPRSTPMAPTTVTEGQVTTEESVWETTGGECPGGQIYKECGRPCTRTCEDLQPWCMYESWCNEGCECPDEAPFWQDGRCIPYKECPVNFTPNDGLEVVVQNNMESWWVVLTSVLGGLLLIAVIVIVVLGLLLYRQRPNRTLTRQPLLGVTERTSATGGPATGGLYVVPDVEAPPAGQVTALPSGDHYPQQLQRTLQNVTLKTEDRTPLLEC